MGPVASLKQPRLLEALPIICPEKRGILADIFYPKSGLGTCSQH